MLFHSEPRQPTNPQRQRERCGGDHPSQASSENGGRRLYRAGNFATSFEAWRSDNHTTRSVVLWLHPEGTWAHVPGRLRSPAEM
jgi:hypothetical protein